MHLHCAGCDWLHRNAERFALQCAPIGLRHLTRMDNTITEQEMDPAAQQFIQGLRETDSEPDLAVDGLSESFAAKLLRVFMFRRS